MNADELRKKLEYIREQCPMWGHGDAILDEAFADLFLHFEMCPFSTGELPDEIIEPTEEEQERRIPAGLIEVPICPICDMPITITVGMITQAPCIGATREDDLTSWQEILACCEICKLSQRHLIHVELWQAIINHHAVWSAARRPWVWQSQETKED